MKNTSKTKTAKTRRISGRKKITITPLIDSTTAQRLIDRGYAKLEKPSELDALCGQRRLKMTARGTKAFTAMIKAEVGKIKTTGRKSSSAPSRPAAG